MESASKYVEIDASVYIHLISHWGEQVPDYEKRGPQKRGVVVPRSLP